jgi:hypothetical protein
MLSRQIVAQNLSDYLNHRITLNELVDWAENAIMQGNVEEGSEKLIMQVLGRIAVADVKEFGLLWEDCEDILKQLGFIIKVDVLKAA